MTITPALTKPKTFFAFLNDGREVEVLKLDRDYFVLTDNVSTETEKEILKKFK